MPNWVDNEVKINRINQTDGFLQEFADRHIVDGKFDFTTIIPVDIPMDQYKGTEVRTLNNGEEYIVGGDWYQWNATNWGTKWNACDTVSDELIKHGYFTFQTAWAPPLPIADRLAKMYPNLTIEWYFREEQGWGGVRLYQDGREMVTMRKDWDIPEDHYENIEVFGVCYACEWGDEEALEEMKCPKE